MSVLGFIAGNLLGDGDDCHCGGKCADCGGMGELGDAVCWPSECDEGKADVLAMANLFARFGYQPSHLQAAVKSITTESAALEARGGSGINIFSDLCCQWAELGRRAQLLTSQIASANNVTPPPARTPTSSVNIKKLTSGVGQGYSDITSGIAMLPVALTVGAVVLGYIYLKKGK